MQEKCSLLSVINLLPLLFISAMTQFSYGQSTDSTKFIHYFGGSVTATNNGISLLPTFSLGKPAGILELKMGRKLTFEPQFRFALEGKPWAFIFWWRYKLINTHKLRLNIGVHPAIIFRTMPLTTIGLEGDIIEAQRYVAAELSPNYFLTENISIGVYYLYGHGFEEATTKNTHFFTINSNFDNIKLPGQLYLKFNPQVYYLRMDERDGFYFTSTLTLARRNFPLSIQSIINKSIQTEIPVSKDFVWNVSLIYSFGKRYVATK